MSVWLSGGTGLVGGRLLAALGELGLTARVVSRSPERLAERPGVLAVGWDGRHPEPESLAGAETAIHLSGEPVFGGLPTAARRARIRESRLASTRALVDAIGQLPSSQRPRRLICASAVGYYGDRGEELLSEESPPGEGFLATLCLDWEAEAARVREHGVEWVSPRIGVVLAAAGGALSMMAPVFKLGLGGRLGSGRQWFPWIHLDDLVGQLLLLREAPDAAGAVNAVAPGAVRNAELTRTLARVVRRPALLPAPGFALRLALGEIAGELLGSRHVVPARAQKLGYDWRYPDLEPALRAELS